MIFFTIASLIAGGIHLESILFSDRADYFMDYFNSVYYGHNNPYMSHKVIYPPLITVFYQVIGVMLETYYGSFTNGFDIRNTPGGMVSYIILTIAALAALYYIFDKGRRISKKEMLLFFLIVITSYPMVYCFDRGNSMLYSVVFISLFLLFYNSPNKKLRYLSYVSLSIATSIKIYPAFFGVLILKRSIEEGDFKELISCVIICVLMFFLPFFLTDGTFNDMFRNAIELSSNRITFGQVNITAILEAFLIGIGVETYADYRNIGTVLSLFLLVLIAVFILFDKTMPDWQAICLLACAQVLCTGLGAQYLLLYMIIPAWYFINSHPVGSKTNIIYSILFVTIILLIPGLGAAGNLLTFLKGVVTLILTILILIESCCRFRNKTGGDGTTPATSE